MLCHLPQSGDQLAVRNCVQTALFFLNFVTLSAYKLHSKCIRLELNYPLWNLAEGLKEQSSPVFRYAVHCRAQAEDNKAVVS